MKYFVATSYGIVKFPFGNSELRQQISEVEFYIITEVWFESRLTRETLLIETARFLHFYSEVLVLYTTGL